MMKITASILAVATIGMLQSCHSTDKNWDSKSSADTLNNMKDSVADPSRSITKILVMKVTRPTLNLQWKPQTAVWLRWCLEGWRRRKALIGR